VVSWPREGGEGSAEDREALYSIVDEQAKLSRDIVPLDLKHFPWFISPYSMQSVVKDHMSRQVGRWDM